MQAPPVKPTKAEFDSDPIGYMQKNIEFEEASAAYNSQMAQLQQVAQKSSAAQENAHKAYMHEQMQILQKEVPAFADPTKASKLRERLVVTGKNHYGYTDNEISNITDARAIKVLLDAQRYQDIISGKSKAKVKTKSAKSVMKPGAKRTATPTAKIRERQKAKLKGSGSIEDAMNLILNT
jgi:lipoprotein-anchoring transpeptidase ErfK/SrfK